jgi:hypothetical protein
LRLNEVEAVFESGYNKGSKPARKLASLQMGLNIDPVMLDRKYPVSGQTVDAIKGLIPWTLDGSQFEF